MKGKCLEKIPEQSNEPRICRRAVGAPCRAAPHEGSPNPGLFCIKHCFKCIPLPSSLFLRCSHSCLCGSGHSPLSTDSENSSRTKELPGAGKKQGMPGKGHGQGNAIPW